MAKAPFDYCPRDCRGPNGRRRCRWCGTEVTPPRRTWCSDKCVAEFRDEWDPAFRRLHTFERDNGKCQLCGRDCGVLERWAAGHGHGYEMRRRRRRFLQRRGLLGAQSQLYDCDHIVPQIEGGTHRSDNLRTLCVPCHKRVTAELARRRAKNPRSIDDVIRRRLDQRDRYPSIAARDMW